MVYKIRKLAKSNEIESIDSDHRIKLTKLAEEDKNDPLGCWGVYEQVGPKPRHDTYT